MNRDVHEGLPAISSLARRLRQFCPLESAAPRRLARRPGLVRDAVFRALAASERPLRAREIHAAAEAVAGEPLSWNTVKDCLHKTARQPDLPVERVGHGSYRLRRASLLA